MISAEELLKMYDDVLRWSPSDNNRLLHGACDGTLEEFIGEEVYHSRRGLPVETRRSRSPVDVSKKPKCFDTQEIPIEAAGDSESTCGNTSSCLTVYSRGKLNATATLLRCLEIARAASDDSDVGSELNADDHEYTQEEEADMDDWIIL
jgi:hypothetical protein